MGVEVLAAAALGAKFLGTLSANQGIGDQIDAAAEQSRLEIQELDRQREEEGRIAQEQKSDRAREADKQFASMIVSLAESGAGAANASRFAGEIGLYEGLDLARIEGNRRRKVSALHSQQVASRNNALSIAKQGQAQQRSNFFNFLGSAASTSMGVQQHNQRLETAKQTRGGST